MSGVTHQKYRLGVVRRLVGEVESHTKEERGEVQDLNKVGLWSVRAEKLMFLIFPGHSQTNSSVGTDAGGSTKEEWEVSERNHRQCGLQHSGQEREISIQGILRAVQADS